MSADKMEFTTQLIVFLGILLNGKMLMLSIPNEKRLKAITLLIEILSKKSATIKDIQKLTGTLNFLNKAIIPGRAFTRGMYQKLKLTDKARNLLKQHHHVYLRNDFKQDCKVWLQFLIRKDLKICHPFMDFTDENNQVKNLYLDASKNPLLGMGAVYDNDWFVMQWEEKFHPKF